MKIKRTRNVFDVLEDDPAVAENLKIRAQLMNALTRFIETQHLTQTDAAQLLGVTQPRISDLVRGKIERFTVDILINMLVRAGQDVHVSVSIKAA